MPDEKHDTTDPEAQATDEIVAELRALASAVESYATTARTLARRRPGRDEPSRESVAAKLRAMRRIWLGLNPDEDSLFNRDARLRLAEGVNFHGAGLRSSCAAVAAEGREAFRDRDARRRAGAVLADVADNFPALAERLTEPARVALVAEAIATRSRRSSMPWKEIHAAWDGVDSGVDVTSWRRDWHAHRKRYPAPQNVDGQDRPFSSRGPP